MAERIEGLSIGLDLDSLQVERGLTGLKDRLRTVNSEMRSNMSAFDRSDRSLGKYETRLKGLNDKLEVQKRVTSEAQANYEKMVKEHGEGSKEAEKASREYNNQAAALNNLEKYVEGATQELENLRKEQEIADSGWTKSGEKLDVFGEKMTNVGDKAQTFGANYMKVTAGVVAGVGGLGVALFGLTSKITSNADEIAKQSVRMGVSTDFYQEMDYWASQNGLSQGDMERAIERTNRRMGEAANGNEKYSEALTKMGVNMDGVRDGTVSTEEAFATSIQTLSEMENEQEKNALAAEFFGQNMSNKLLPALQDGSLSMEEAKKMAHEYGLVMSEEQLKAAEEFQDAQDTAKRAMGGIVNEIGLELMPQFQTMLDWVLANMPKIRETITEMMDQVKERVSTTVTWFRELSGAAKKWIGIAAGLAIALGPLSFIFGTLLKALGPFVSIIGRAFMVVGRLGGLLPALRVGLLALTGPVGIIIGVIAALTAGFIYAYNTSETFRDRIDKAIGGAKDAFKNALSYIKPAIETVVQTVKNFGASIVEFWSENSESISQAINNIMTGIMIFFEFFLGIVKTFWPAIELIFKTAWDAIILVFTVAKNTIMGIVQIFVGLFTGDTDKMMEGVKTIFSGGFGAIIDFVKSFIGNVITFFIDLSKNLVDSVVPDMINAVLDWFRNLGKRSGEIVSNMVKNVVQYFLDLKDRSIARVVELRDNTVQRFTNLRDRFLSLGGEIRDGVTRLMTKMKDNTIGRVLDMRTEAVKRFGVMKDRFFDVGRDIRDNIKDRFDDMVTAARELPGRIGDGIKNMASRATSGVKSFANSIGETLEDGVNKVVGGMNNLLGKIGVTLRIPQINVPQYATGTKDHPGGPAIVGEKGRELAHIPGKGYTILGRQGAELLDLPKGSSVLPNRITETLLKKGMGLPGYESGVGRAFNWVKGKVKSGWENAKGLASDAMGWLMDAPRKIFDKAMEFVGVSMPRADDFSGSIMRGNFSGLRDSVVEKLIDAQKEVVPGQPSFGGQFRMTSPFGWRTHPVTGDRRHHNGVDYAAPTGTPLKSQSTGKVTFSGVRGGFGNLVTVKSGMFDHLYAHNSRNLVNVGQGVSKGQTIGLVGSTGMSTGPHVHYEIRKNGTPVNPKGFKTGGLIKEKMMTLLGDGGYPEYVIPTDPSRATEAMKLLALAGKDVEKRGGAKRPSQLPNISNSHDYQINDYLQEMIDKLSEQVTETKEIVSILLQVLAKDFDVIMNGKIVGKLLEKHITKEQERKRGRKERAPRAR